MLHSAGFVRHENRTSLRDKQASVNCTHHVARTHREMAKLATVVSEMAGSRGCGRCCLFGLALDVAYSVRYMYEAAPARDHE